MIRHLPIRRGRAARRAFTLLEILLSLALVALIFTALNTFIFSMGELWGRRNEPRLFDLHVRAVTRFLDQTLRTAALPPEAQPNSAPIAPQEIRPLNGPIDNLLTFELPNGCRLFEWPGTPLPDVICSLQVRQGAGLFLLWHSKLEKRFNDDPPRETLITPFVTALSYDYYDADQKRWQTETMLRRDPSNASQFLAPQRLRFQFTYDKMTREALVPLLTPAQGLPDY